MENNTNANNNNVTNAKNGKDMIPATGYAALRDVDLPNLLGEELEDMNFAFDRIHTPKAGGTTFEVPGEIPGETDSVTDFTAVILYHHPLSFFFKDPYTGKKTQPTCCSYDGTIGIGTPGGNCRTCRLNKWGSRDNGAKLCKNKQRVYLLREGDMLPVILSIPTGSLTIFKQYVCQLITRGLRYSGVVSRFHIVHSQGDGPSYPQVKVSFVRKLTEEELACVSPIAGAVKEYAKNRQIEEYPEEVIDPETGEIIPAEV